MKKLSRIFLFQILVAMTLAISAEAIEVQGHRGGRGWWPENTIPAFLAGIEAGADVLELDLLVTSDGELIIYHDFYLNQDLCVYLDGTPITGSYLVHHLTLSEIKNIDCGARRHPLFPEQQAIPGTQIPTLQELFAAIHSASGASPKAERVFINLEIKIDPAHPELTLNRRDFAKKVVQAAASSGMAERILYSSFDRDVLAEVRILQPDAKIAFLLDEETLSEAWHIKTSDWVQFMIETANQLKADTVSPEHVLLTQEIVDQLHQAGFRVVTWTVNERNRWDDLLQMQVDGLITDYP